MNNIKNILIVIAIFLGLLTLSFIFGYQYCKKVNNAPTTSENVVIERDTTWVTVEIAKPIPYAVIDTIEIPQIVDTAAIIKDYYKERYYNFPMQFGTVSFKVTQNSLFDYKANIFTTTITKTVYPKYILGVGGHTGIFMNQIFIEASAFYTTKHNTFSAGISYPIGIRVGYYYTFFKY